MQLDWVVNHKENRLTFEIDNLRYTTVDGGQNIDKYIDGEFDKRIRQFPEKPADWLQPHMSPPMVPTNDEWGPEIDWLIKTYPEQLGERCDSYQYRERDGSITTETFVRGQGANTIAMLGEDGVERILPTQKYVQALEEQIRQQQVAITTINRKLTRLSTAHDHLAARATSST